MLTIRLFRTGKKNQPVFRIVVTDKKNPPRGGRFVEIVGSYNPQSKEKKLKQERIKYWLSVGAQPSDTVHNLLVSERVIEGKRIPVHATKKKEPSVAKAMEGEEKLKKTEEAVKKTVMEKAEAESPKKEPEEKPAEEPKTEEEEKPKKGSKEEKKRQEEKKSKEEKPEGKPEEKPKEETDKKGNE